MVGSVRLGAQQARQSMPPEAYAELLKAKPANGKPAYVRLTGLPAPVIVEVQAVTPPEDIAAQLPPANRLWRNSSLPILSTC
ncbi:peptidyl-prolyl cis-trans isomerase [Neisseria gonorrhoeae]|uniref:Peptidyl-prolyl cis-trans isomerase n=1 Tax=Neisseria gonorrhoeae TaxID=485 RepID=A0A378VWR9_NEIGO|nr:peptidyl-prolyl cis-trans isomerase [Neisseria gonorrhoeae]